MDGYALSILTMTAFTQQEEGISFGPPYREVRLPYLHTLLHSSVRS